MQVNYYSPGAITAKLNLANYMIAPVQGTRKIVERTTEIINKPLKFIQPKKINSIFSQIASLFGKVLQTEEKNSKGQTISKIYKKHGITIERTKLNTATGKKLSTIKYNKLGIKTTEIFYYEDELTAKYVNVYDPRQRKKLCKIKYDKNGIATEATKLNEHGLKVKKILFDTDGKSPIEIFKYRGGKLVKHTKNDGNTSTINYFNATTGELMNEAHLDKNNDSVLIKEFSKDGKVAVATYGHPLPSNKQQENNISLLA